MTDNTGRTVKVSAADYGKIFLAVMVAAAVPVASAMMYGWRDIAIVQNDRHHDQRTIEELRVEVREIKSDIKENNRQVSAELTEIKRQLGRIMP